MAPRLDLHALLKVLLGSDNVYFQEPPTAQMSYPAIRYEHSDTLIRHSDNKPYSTNRRYQVTVMDMSPDSQTTLKMEKLPLCSFDRHFVADGLHHTVYQLFF